MYNHPQGVPYPPPNITKTAGERAVGGFSRAANLNTNNNQNITKKPSFSDTQSLNYNKKY